MGLRGPGAKPVKRKDKPAESEAKPARRPKWKRRGLSRAERVVAFIESLPITSGSHAGKPFQVRPWQRSIIEDLYRTDDAGLRIVREAVLSFPRKNGKTGLVAALALAHIFGPEAEPRGQVYSAAADKDQAALLYAEMKAIIEASPELEERAIIRDFNKTIEDAETGTVYKALSADARTKHGFSASVVIYDELAQAPDRTLYDVLTTSTGARAEPLTIVISTQNNNPLHVMSELVDYGLQVRAGILDDPTFHLTLYAAPDNADPFDEAVWHACNPALGDFRSLPEMRAAAAKARRIPARLPVFKNLYLNMRVDAEERWISAEDWDACNAPVDLATLRGRPCWCGLDLGSTRDLTALVLYFPEDDGALWPFFWVPGETIGEREERDRVPYGTWAAEGFIEPTKTRAVDRRAIACKVAEITAAFDVRAIAYDRHRIEDLRIILDDEGLDLPMIGFGQGYVSMGPAVDSFEALVLDRRLHHGGHPVLAWNVSNATIQTDPAGNRKVTKERSIDRVDGLVAALMAVGIHAKEEAPPDFSSGIVINL